MAANLRNSCTKVEVGNDLQLELTIEIPTRIFWQLLAVASKPVAEVARLQNHRSYKSSFETTFSDLRLSAFSIIFRRRKIVVG